MVGQNQKGGLTENREEDFTGFAAAPLAAAWIVTKNEIDAEKLHEFETFFFLS